MYYFNPYLANVPILHPLKTPENLWFSGVFRGYKMRTLARNGLNVLMAVELASLKIGKTSCCKPEKLKKNICNPSQMS